MAWPRVSLSVSPGGPPADVSFAKSDALFPPVELRTAIAAGFESQYRVLCFGPFSRLLGVRPISGFLQASWGQTDLELSPQEILNRSDPKAQTRNSKSV